MPMRDATVAQRYAAMVASGQLTKDPAQTRIVQALDALRDALAARALARKSSALGWLFARKPQAASVPKGLYVHGGVGRGKTMLMDLFFQQVDVKSKRRIHFNGFMADVHDRIQKQRKARKDGETSEDDPIPPVARQIAGEASLLCFDEFSVTDIADAMILSRLFSALFGEGVVLVATSNVAPDDLYRDGLNRALFEPFIALLKSRVEVLCLDSPTDHRMAKLARLPVYVTPLGEEADRLLDEAFEAATGGASVGPAEIVVKGRTIPVPRASGATARFAFADLCEKPLGARDYIAITERFTTIFVDRIPVLSAAKRNEAKRLILLIDTLYDRHVRLFASAEAAPDSLYPATSGTEAFEFARTASRLMDMQSRDWQEAWTAKNRSGDGR